MRAKYYAIRWEPFQLVAVEIDVAQAAAFLDAARPVLLATPAELTQLARQRKQVLAVIAGSTYSCAQPSLTGTTDAAGRSGHATQVSGRPARVWLDAGELQDATAVSLPAA